MIIMYAQLAQTLSRRPKKKNSPSQLNSWVTPKKDRARKYALEGLNIKKTKKFVRGAANELKS